MANALHRLIILSCLFLVGLDFATADELMPVTIVESPILEEKPKKPERLSFSTDFETPMKRFIVNSNAQEKFSLRFVSSDGSVMKDLIVCLSEEMDPLSGIIINVKTIRFSSYLEDGTPYMEVETGVLNPCFYIIKPKYGQLDIISRIKGIAHLIVKQSSKTPVNYLLKVDPIIIEPDPVPEPEPIPEPEPLPESIQEILEPVKEILKPLTEKLPDS